MEKEVYKAGPGWVEPPISNEWVEMLNKPRVMKPTPGVDEDKFCQVFMLLRRKGISCFKVNIPPGAHQVKHGHTQGAVFYVLEGKGYDIHDGVRYDWDTGDAAILHDGGVVHNQYNPNPESWVRMLIFTYPRAYDGQNLVAGGLVEAPTGLTPEGLSLSQTVFREGATD